jgi:recombinational DNA repair ATPase RecF
VWDQRLADAGKILVTARERLVSALGGFVGPAYGRLAGDGIGSW